MIIDGLPFEVSDHLFEREGISRARAIDIGVVVGCGMAMHTAELSTYNTLTRIPTDAEGRRPELTEDRVMQAIQKAFRPDEATA